MEKQRLFYHSFVVCLIFSMAAVFANHVTAQGPAKLVATYPSKPVAVVIPFAAGGSIDNGARFYLDKLIASMGQSFVFDFRPGAASSIGVTHMLSAAPDGHTIMLTNPAITLIPNFFPALSHIAVSQLIPITEVNKLSTGVVISTAVLPNVYTLQDLLVYAKANPGKLSCGTAGSGSITHAVCAAFSTALGESILPVHYKGAAQFQPDLIAGRISLSMSTLSLVLPQINTGKLRIIAALGPDRSRLLPDMRTSYEQGYEVDFPTWVGAFAPPKTPQPIIDKLNSELFKAVKSPDVVQSLEKLGVVPVASSQEDFRKKFSSELVYWKKIVEINKIQATE